MLSVFIMDGISLGGIMEMIRPLLPTLSYFINFLTKMFELFTSYLGFDITIPEEESTTEEATTL